MTTTIPTTIRNGSVQDLQDRMATEKARRADFVVTVDRITTKGNRLVVIGDDAGQMPTMEMIIGPEAVETMADRFSLPLAFMRESHRRGEEPELTGDVETDLPAEMASGVYADAFAAMIRARVATPGKNSAPRKVLLRTWKPETEGDPYYLRAVLSDRYWVVDNLDTWMATAKGIAAAGMPVEVRSIDYTDKRMRVRFVAPGVQYVAEEFLKGYKNPFQGRTDPRHTAPAEPLIFAGFELANSELGYGAMTLTPRFEIQICTNGLRVSYDVFRAVHLGGRQNVGEIDWSVDTQRKTLEVVQSQVTDTVVKFLDPEFIRAAVESLQKMAETPLEDPKSTLELVARELKFTEQEEHDVFAMFMNGGQNTAGGVLQAVTAAAQLVIDPERAAELEDLGIRALELAAA